MDMGILNGKKIVQKLFLGIWFLRNQRRISNQTNFWDLENENDYEIVGFVCKKVQLSVTNES